MEQKLLKIELLGSWVSAKWKAERIFDAGLLVQFAEVDQVDVVVAVLSRVMETGFSW